jgi:hypothetical protein
MSSALAAIAVRAAAPKPNTVRLSMAAFLFAEQAPLNHASPRTQRTEACFPLAAIFYLA